MGFSKKALIGLVSGITVSTVAIGTGIGLGINQNSNSSINTNTSNTETKPNKENEEKPTNNKPANELNELISKINKDVIVVKKLSETLESNSSNETLKINDLYAFNVVDKQLELDPKKIELPKNIKPTFDLKSTKNTASYLNSGKVEVNLTLKDESTQNQESITIELDGFKVAELQEEFKKIFENDGKDLVIKIDPSSSASNKFVSLDFLNEEIKTPVEKSRSDLNHVSRQVSDENEEEEFFLKTQSGLNSWIQMDETKKSNLTNISLFGQVKLKEISISEDMQKTYFHLIPKDENSHIKLVNKNGEEIAVNEIKTTNLLANDIVLIPKEIDQDGTGNFLEALKKEQVDQDAKYETDLANASLNRLIHINLATSKTPANNLFIKPYLVKKSEAIKEELAVVIEVKFGKDDYLTTYRTDNKNQLEQLKKTGFNFGVYTKKLDSTDDIKIKPSVFTNKKDDLAKYFKPTNYSQPIARQTIATQQQEPKKYPGGFWLSEFKNGSLTKELKLKVDKTSDLKTSQNLLAFVDYSYKGIDMNNMKFLYTPSISLIHLEANATN